MVCLMAVLLAFVFRMSLVTSHGAADLMNHCHTPGQLCVVGRECVYVSDGSRVASEVSVPSSVYHNSLLGNASQISRKRADFPPSPLTCPRLLRLHGLHGQAALLVVCAQRH